MTISRATRDWVADAVGYGISHAKVARSAGISRETIGRWMKNDPVFQARVKGAVRRFRAEADKRWGR